MGISERGPKFIGRSADDMQDDSTDSDDSEEPDVDESIEESINDKPHIPPPFSKHNDPRDPPKEMLVDPKPVGLKNIGNSCWFNVIAQTLFNIPSFRQMLLYYDFKTTGPNSVRCIDEPTTSAVVARPIYLIVSMRRAFAYLLASKRSYIDPTETINVVNALITSSLSGDSCLGNQQDCSEMLLRFTEWFEKAFECTSTSKTSTVPSKATNVCVSRNVVKTNPPAQNVNVTPMKSQDYGIGSVKTKKQPLKEKVAEATTAQNPGSSRDSGKPYAMASSSNRRVDTKSGKVIPKNSSADAASFTSNKFVDMFYGSHVEYRNGRVVESPELKNKFQLINLDISYGNLHDSFEAYHLANFPMNELWYEAAPPIIVFSLGRVQYKNGQTEKIHSKFRFPRSFYLDRYLKKNREFVLGHRAEKISLERKRSIILKKLDRLLGHPVGDSHEPVPQIISALLKFINMDSRRPFAEPGNEDLVDVYNESMPSTSTAHCLPFDIFAAFDNIFSKEGKILKCGHEETASVKDFLRSFACEVQSKITVLQGDLDALNMEIETFFDVDSMMKERYRLHSVIIHEGEADAGHYWTYIADYSTLDDDNMPSVWWKYDDKCVNIVTYEDVMLDAFGSKPTCSAYCIVYSRCQSEDTLFGDDLVCCMEIFTQGLNLLPRDLRKEVSDDNRTLERRLHCSSSRERSSGA